MKRSSNCSRGVRHSKPNLSFKILPPTHFMVFQFLHGAGFSWFLKCRRPQSDQECVSLNTKKK